jgi:hypothetical protein
VSVDEDVKQFEFESKLAPWWYVARHYESEDEALEAFERMNAFAARLKGKAEIAGYRLLDAYPPEGKARLVVVIGLIEQRVREAAVSLKGERWEMPPNQVRGLIARRIRFLYAGKALGAEPGVHVFRHGKSGMHLDDAGRVVPND